MRFEILDEDNFLLYAIKNYTNPICTSMNEFTEDMDKQLSTEAGIDKQAAYAATDLMVSNLKFRLSKMADWMDSELKARGGE